MFPYGQYSIITHKSQYRPVKQQETNEKVTRSQLNSRQRNGYVSRTLWLDNFLKNVSLFIFTVQKQVQFVNRHM